MIIAIVMEEAINDDFWVSKVNQLVVEAGSRQQERSL
jgi:hypothetical protein